MRRSSKLGLGAIAAVAIALASVGPAAAKDYDVDAQEWNGLGMFVSLARGVGYRVESSSTIDWSDVDKDDILVMIYPTKHIDPFDVAGFLQSGGRLIIADDFGEGAKTLAELRVLREPARGIRARYHNNLAFAPIADVKAKGHPLADKVDELTCNHPAIFSSVGDHTVVFGFKGDEAVVVEGKLGRGRFVALSDPSLLINRMLQFKGNMQFAINLIRYFDGPDARSRGRIIVLHSDFSISGKPPVPKGGRVASLLDQFNRWLLDRNNYLLTNEATRAIAILSALLVSLLGLASLPLLRRTGLDGSWTRARPDGGPLSSFEELVDHFDTRSRRKNFLLPAAVLRDSCNQRLGELLGREAPIFNMGYQVFVEELRRLRGAAVAEAGAAVFPRLKRLPTRVQAASPWTSMYLSRHEFELLHDDVNELYRTLGEQPKPM